MDHPMTKKAAKAKRSFKPTGRLPVLAIRVPEPLRLAIRASAEKNGKNLSEETMELILSGLRWNAAFEAGLLDKGFQRLHGTPKWVKLPDDPLNKTGFKHPDEVEPFLHPNRPTEVAEPIVTEAQINAELDKLNRELDALEKRIREIRTTARKKESSQCAAPSSNAARIASA
jgi:hypothetical protein